MLACIEEAFRKRPGPTQTHSMEFAELTKNLKESILRKEKEPERWAAIENYWPVDAFCWCLPGNEKSGGRLHPYHNYWKNSSQVILYPPKADKETLNLPDDTRCECEHFKRHHNFSHDEWTSCDRRYNCDYNKFRPMTEKMSEEFDKKLDKEKMEKWGKAAAE
jgi:hypothetical protein